MRTRKSHGRLRYPQGDPPKIRGWLSVEICILPRTHRMSMALSRTEARSDDNFCSHKYLHPYTRWNSCRNMSLNGKWLHEWSCNLWNRKTFISLHHGDLYISDCRHYHCIYHSSYSLMQKIISPLLSLAAWGVFGFWLAISDMLSHIEYKDFSIFSEHGIRPCYLSWSVLWVFLLSDTIFSTSILNHFLEKNGIFSGKKNELSIWSSSHDLYFLESDGDSLDSVLVLRSEASSIWLLKQSYFL